MKKEKINAWCSICGKGYHLCISCDKDSSFAWKQHTDTSEHYKIFQIIRGHFLGVYSDEEAADKLSNVDLSDYKTFKDEIKLEIKKIQNAKNNKEMSRENKAKFINESKETAKNISVLDNQKGK